MKNILLSFLFLMCNQIYSQGYFDGKDLNCPTENLEAKRLFESGIKILHLNVNLDPKNIDINANIFAKAVEQDTTFCDAYFFTGYLLNLNKRYKEAYAFLSVADMLSVKPSFLYKQNLASLCFKVGMYEEARKTYQELSVKFPTSPEGFYGIAATSPMIGDYKNGIENIIKAENKYTDNKTKTQCNLIKGILLTLDGQNLEAKNTLEKVSWKYNNDINFNIHYSLALLKLADLNNNKKMKKKAKRIYSRIKNKNYIPPDLQSEFKF